MQEGKIALCFCWVYDTVCTSWNTVKLSCNSLFPGYWHFIGNCCIVLWKQGTYAKHFKKCKRRKQLQLLSHTAFMLISHALQGWYKFQQTLYCSRLIKLTVYGIRFFVCSATWKFNAENNYSLCLPCFALNYSTVRNLTYKYCGFCEITHSVSSIIMLVNSLWSLVLETG